MVCFSARLKKLREEKILRQKDLAEKVRVAQTTIANYEQGTRFPDEETLCIFADFFNVSLDYLLGRTPARKCVDYSTYEETYLSKKEDKILSGLTLKFKDALLSGNKMKASNLIINAANNGINIKDIYLHLFEKTLKEIGYLWETGEINPGMEHYITGVTQTIMSQLHQHIDKKNNGRHSIVSLSANGEFHDIGVRMVSDFMEMEGWNAYFLGNNIPTESIIKIIKNYNADVLAISATMPYNINSVHTLINSVRSDKDCKKVKFIVGGSAFNLTGTSPQEVNADGFAENAGKAVQVIKNFVGEI